jgi:hypothetical protein
MRESSWHFTHYSEGRQLLQKVDMADANVTYEQLVDLAEGRVPQDRRAPLLARVQADPQLHTEYVRILRLISLMRADDSIDAPEAVLQRVIKLFRSRVAEARPGLLRRLGALLTFDSAQSPLAVGLRSTSVGPRQMLFSAEAYDIDVRLSPAGENEWTIVGQVLGEDTSGAVRLNPPGVQAELNALGEFALSAVPAGRYSLTVALRGLEIETPEFTVGAM